MPGEVSKQWFATYWWYFLDCIVYRESNATDIWLCPHPGSHLNYTLNSMLWRDFREIIWNVMRCLSYCSGGSNKSPHDSLSGVSLAFFTFLSCRPNLQDNKNVFRASQEPSWQLLHQTATGPGGGAGCGPGPGSPCQMQPRDFRS